MTQTRDLPVTKEQPYIATKARPQFLTYHLWKLIDLSMGF